jgi:hypothetical protein
MDKGVSKFCRRLFYLTGIFRAVVYNKRYKIPLQLSLFERERD